MKIDFKLAYKILQGIILYFRGNNTTEFPNLLARAAVKENWMGQRHTFSSVQQKTNKFKLFCMALQRHGLHTFSVKESQGTRAKRHIWNKQSSFSAISPQFSSHSLGVPGRSQELPQQMCCTHSPEQTALASPGSTAKTRAEGRGIPWHSGCFVCWWSTPGQLV